MGKLAKHFGGGFSIEYQKRLDWFEILEWDNTYKLQKMENQVVEEMSYDGNGKPKKLPPYSTIREEVERRLEENETDYEEKLKEYGRRE